MLTLSSLKFRFKLSLVLILLTVYGVGAYSVGKYASIKEKVHDAQNLLKIQGVATKSSKLDSPIESPAPYNDSQDASILASYVKLCSNTTYSFEVAYPKDWFTTFNTQEQNCTFFAPFSFVVPQVADGDFVPIKIEVVSADQWLDNRKFHQNPNDFLNVVSSQNIEIAGKSVEKIKAVSTGAGKLQKGLEKVTYLVFDAKSPLIFTYQQLDEKEDVASYEKVLEDMVVSLKYF